MHHPAPLLLVYDAEDRSCRAVVDWVRRRDQACLIVAFPWQNPELVQLAPEVAGRPLLGTVLGLDTRTRVVCQGVDLVPQVYLRLPIWNWLAPLFAIPSLARIAYAWMRRSSS